MYKLQFLNKAVKDLANIDLPFRRLIKEKLLLLAENPKALQNNITKLVGADEDFYRLRVGSYRVIFKKEEEKLIIIVVRIGHRREIYLSLN